MLPFVHTRRMKLTKRSTSSILPLSLGQTSVYVTVLALIAQCADEVCGEDTGGAGSHIPWKIPGGEDDAILSEDQQQFYYGPPSSGKQVRKEEKWRWPKAEVVYELDPAYSSAEKSLIMRGMKHIEDKTVVRFRTKKQNDKDYVKMKRRLENVCSSAVGRQGGAQNMSLGPNCMYHWIIVHELTHAIGIEHEQCRSDRDDWVDINWDNILEDKRMNFMKFSVDEVQQFGVKYNYNSLLHYGAYTFSINSSMPTIIPKREGVIPEDLGPKSENLTAGDILKINLMHGHDPNGSQRSYVFQNYFAFTLCCTGLLNILTV